MDQHENLEEYVQASGEKRHAGLLKGALVGVLGTIVLGLAAFGAISLAGRLVDTSHAAASTGMSDMMRQRDAGSSASQGTKYGDMAEMANVCTQHMSDMNAMMQMMQSTAAMPGTPEPNR